MSTPQADKPAALCLAIDFRLLGNSRKVTEGVETEADKSYITVTKRLFKSAEYDAIRRADAATKDWLRSFAIPAPALRKGMYLVPPGYVEKIATGLPLRLEARKELVKAFQGVYSSVIDKAAIELRGLFNVDDYPSTDEVPAFFGMSWRFLAMDVPSSLKQVSSALFAEERKKAEEQWSAAMEEARKVLRATMQALVSKLDDALAPDQFGDTKTLRDAGIVKLRDFLSTFDTRDITGDAELAALVKTAKGLVRGVRAEDVNKDKEIRTQLANGFAGMREKLDGMVTTKPKRAISLEDDDL